MLKKATTYVTLFSFILFVSMGDLVSSEQAQVKKPTFEELYRDYSFLDTATLSEIVSYDEKALDQEVERLEQKEDVEKKEAENVQKKAKEELKKRQEELKGLSDQLDKIHKKYETEEIVVADGKPHKEKRVEQEKLNQDTQYQTLQSQKESLECQIRGWDIKSNNLVYKAKLESIKIGYEVQQTQLGLLRHWPEELKKIKELEQSGQVSERIFAHPENIGLRDLDVGNQGDDVRILQSPGAQQFIEELKKKEYKNDKIKAYVIGLLENIAQNSDLKIPIEDKNILISEDDDVNAFALPGGFINVNTGLLMSVENEAQLAGVLAHEIGHVTARHSYRLNKKASLLGILFQAVQLGAMIFTGGSLTFLTYYLLKYGLAGLGMLIDLKLLGVTRSSELEADILGEQYMWHAGYDPLSFMNFFEKMGRDKGYLRGTSWFRTHPAFSERIVNAFREFHYLPPKDEYLTQSDKFLEMKTRLCLDQEMEKELEKEGQVSSYRPSLTRKNQNEKKRIEDTCGLPKPPEQKVSPCADPQLQSFKEKIREELAKEKDKEKKDGIQLKRPSLEKLPGTPLLVN